MSSAASASEHFSPGDYRDLLSPVAFDHLRHCCNSLADRQYLGAVIWAAVFLEAFLGDLAAELGLPRAPSGDLSDRIQQLQNFSRNNAAGQVVPDDVIKRFHDIRNTRNRLVHDTGLAKTTLAVDAAYVAAGLKVILDWRRSQRPASTIRGDAPPSGDAETPAMVPMFLSTISPHLPQQEDFIDAITHRLRTIGVQAVRLKFTDFDQKDPLKKARAVIGSCRGALVVGLERSHAYYIRDNEGGKREPKVEKEHIHRKYTSGWLHMEAAIANALGLPVFLLCQQDICSDGIFDRYWNTYPVTELDALDVNTPQLREFFEHLEQWAAEERQQMSNPPQRVR